MPSGAASSRPSPRLWPKWNGEVESRGTRDPMYAPAQAGGRAAASILLWSSDTATQPWTELSRTPILSVSAKGVKWQPGFGSRPSGDQGQST